MSNGANRGAISVLAYGRNDGHGYNLARRAALSLNAFAHVLGDLDEILFADCNTPDALPTFPESISDTLTEKTRALLRVVRVRPSEFRRLCPKTRLKVHEPLCRNVLLRRSRPENTWILSTNTDIVPSYGAESSPLSGLVAGLDPDFLHIAPRAEVPEQLWEGIDRRDPARVHELFRRWARDLGLGEQVDCGPTVLHDGPGDFQLVGRNTLWEIDGFDEGILQGWHVDGNLCARMKIRNGRNLSLEGSVVAFHCDHNRQATPSHRSGFTSESAHDLVHGVRSADIPGQRESWGAPALDLEEFQLPSDSGIRFGDRLGAQYGEAPLPVVSNLGRDEFNSSLGLAPEIAFTHLASHLATLRRGGHVAYAGRCPRMVDLLRQDLSTRSTDLLVCPDLLEGGDGGFWEGWKSANGIVFDAWAGDLLEGRCEFPRDLRRESSSLGEWSRRQDKVLRSLHAQGIRSGKAPAFLFVGSQNTWLDIDLNRFFDITLTPFASHVRPAMIRPELPAWKEGMSSFWARRKARLRLLRGS